MFATNVKSIILNSFLLKFVSLHILFHNSDKEFGYLVIKQEFRMILSLKKSSWQAVTIASQVIPGSQTLKKKKNVNTDQVSGFGWLLLQVAISKFKTKEHFPLNIMTNITKFMQKPDSQRLYISWCLK